MTGGLLTAHPKPGRLKHCIVHSETHSTAERGKKKKKKEGVASKLKWQQGTAWEQKGKDLN